MFCNIFLFIRRIYYFLFKIKPKRKITCNYKKSYIPKAIKEQTWLNNYGKTFENKCYISWCKML